MDETYEVSLVAEELNFVYEAVKSAPIKGELSKLVASVLTKIEKAAQPQQEVAYEDEFIEFTEDL